MKTITTSALALLLAVGFAGPAFAAASTNPAPTNNSQTAPHEPGGTSVRQQVQSDLAKAGFTDIKVMPESFLVRAKDSKGNSVMMVINPDSLTEVTTMQPPKGNASASNENASTSDKMTKGATAPPAAPAPKP